MAEQIIIILAGISLLIIIPKLLAARRLNSELKQKYGKIIDLEEERDRIDRQNKKLSTDIENRKTAWEKDFSEAAEELAQLQEKLETARDQEHMQSFGLYEAHYDFESSVGYKAKLDQIRAQQKDLVKRKIAAVCDEEWTMQGSRAKGRQMEQRYLRLLLRAFNGECDSIVFKVNYRNITAMEQRVSRSFDALNKLGESQYCRITPEYLDLKISEIRLVHEFQEKKQAEKEEQRLIREQMREEERARREAEKAQAEAEREERRYESALEKARRELQRAGDDKRTELEREIERLQEQLEEAHQNKERAISRAQLTKSGHVYIISNIGSFGENIYKIGLTRRLDPDDRIKELGDASVPFPFDVHAMIYSEDAPSLENLLHQAFDDRRVNMVNMRKEFFRVSMDEIQGTAKDYGPIQFTLAAEAEEYRKTLALQEHQEGRSSVESDADEAKALLEQRKESWGR